MLRGGYDAQIQFLKHQLAGLERLHNLSFTPTNLQKMPQGSYTGTDMEQIPDSDRQWMSNPYRLTFIDYKEVVPSSKHDSGAESEEETYRLGKHRN